MKAESNIMPSAPFEIIFDGDECEVTFFDDVIQISEADGESSKWEYSEYRIRIGNREGIVTQIENNFNAWLQLVKAQEYQKLAAEIRVKRNELIAQTDYLMLPDYVGLTDAQKTAITEYRQSLRDITNQVGFPYNVQLPQRPEV